MAMQEDLDEFLDEDEFADSAAVTLPNSTAKLINGDPAGDSGLIWTAKAPGVAGNNISVEIAANAGGPVEIAVIGNAITVYLQRDETEQIVTTAQEVKAAVEADEVASALVNVNNYATSTGDGVMDVAAKTNLSGGADPLVIKGIFDEPFVDGEAGEAHLETGLPTFLCKSTDAALVHRGYPLVVKARTFDVVQVQPDGTGMSVIKLSE